MGDRPMLRAFRETDLEFLDQLGADPEALGPFEWAGFGDVRANRRRWEQDGFIGTESAALAVELVDGTIAGIASWKVKDYGSPGACYEIGVALLPEHRGQGLGTAAQRLLVDYLFKFTTAHRLEALTDAENVPERKALERVGFKREGITREVFFQNGTWRDHVIYALLRDEWTSQGTD